MRLKSSHPQCDVTLVKIKRSFECVRSTYVKKQCSMWFAESMFTCFMVETMGTGDVGFVRCDLASSQKVALPDAI